SNSGLPHDHDLTAPARVDVNQASGRGQTSRKPARAGDAADSNKQLDWLGRLDSNQGSRNQNPLPYHLATPQQRQGRTIGGKPPPSQPPRPQEETGLTAEARPWLDRGRFIAPARSLRGGRFISLSRRARAGPDAKRREGEGRCFSKSKFSRHWCSGEGAPHPLASLAPSPS